MDRFVTSAVPVKRYYRPELDVLRFCAFLGVFLYHVILPDTTAAAPHFFAAFPALARPLLSLRMAASAGLPIFFLLSAFLITELLIRERETTGTIHIPPFYLRRILRIWPLYFLALGIAALFALYKHSHEQLFFVGTCALFVGNWSQ